MVALSPHEWNHSHWEPGLCFLNPLEDLYFKCFIRLSVRVLGVQAAQSWWWWWGERRLLLPTSCPDPAGCLEFTCDISREATSETHEEGCNILIYGQYLSVPGEPFSSFHSWLFFSAALLEGRPVKRSCPAAHSEHRPVASATFSCVSATANEQRWILSSTGSFVSACAS